MKVDITTKTDPGTVRSQNEDGVRSWPSSLTWCVLDGMGGQHTGYWAVEMLFEALDALCEAHPDASPEVLIEPANVELHRRVSEHGHLHGLGAAGLLARVSGDVLQWAHVGNCRLYRLREESLTLLSRDHTLLQEYLDYNLIDPAKVVDFPHKDVITRALGMKDSIEPESGEDVMRPGDVYIGCSDGLHDMISDARLEHVLTYSGLAGEELAERLIWEANMAGGKDNISVVVVHVSDIAWSVST